MYLLHSLLEIGCAFAHPLLVCDIGEPQAWLKALLVLFSNPKFYFRIKWALRSLTS